MSAPSECRCLRHVQRDIVRRAMEDPLLQTLHDVWKVPTFRPCQREAIEAALSGRDSLVLLPTGGGKSLCYALFAAYTQKTAVVVSPLISLMVDQVKSLTEKGIASTFLGSAQDNSSDVSDAIQGRMQVVFMTPEKVVAMSKCVIPNVGLIAVDEAHCTSEWGSDFRPEYGELKCLRTLIGRQVPVMALTASATPDVQKHIASILGLNDPVVLQTSFDRTNLRFRAVLKPKRDFADVISVELSGKGRLPAIVYVPNVRDAPGKPGVETIAAALHRRGFRVQHYHGQMTAEDRAQSQRAFVSLGEADVMVATLAFGMGIDKPDVRTVLHWGACKSIESYFQQAGRAGRDGCESECVLFHGASDWPMLFQMAKSSVTAKSAVDAATRRVAEMRQYCETTACRRLQLLTHFGEHPLWTKCEMCDNCTITPEANVLEDYTSLADRILFAVGENERHKFSMTRLTALLSGDVPQEWMRHLAGFASVQDHPTTLVRGVIDRMVGHSLLARVEVSIAGYAPFQSFVVGAAARGRDTGDAVLLSRVEVAAVKRSRSTLGGGDLQQLDTLKRLRASLARGKPAYTVATNDELSSIVLARPRTLNDLRAIPGFGPTKVAKYGADFLEAVNGFSE